MVIKHSIRRLAFLANVLRRRSTAVNAFPTFSKLSIFNIFNQQSAITGRKSPPTSQPQPQSPPHLPLGKVAGSASPTTPSFNPPAFSHLGPDRKWDKTKTATSAAAAVECALFSQFSPALLLGREQLIVPSLPLSHAMASYAYSTSSSDISTPRSRSPSTSVISGRSSHSSVSNKRMSISSRRISAANPMSSVDISSIEEAMKMASLDTLRGYAQNHYGQVQQYATTEYIPQHQAAGYQVLREPLWNKGELTLSGTRRSCMSISRDTARSESIPSPINGSFRPSGPPFLPNFCSVLETTYILVRSSNETLLTFLPSRNIIHP